MNKRVWVQVDEADRAIRIFKNKKRAFEDSLISDFVEQMDYSKAMSQIRRQVFESQNGECAKCPSIITRQGFHLHERLPRGEFDSDGRSGEVSLSNSCGLCANCHIGPGGEHSDRLPRFGAARLELL
jgi:hypothetical protein